MFKTNLKLLLHLISKLCTAGFNGYINLFAFLRLAVEALLSWFPAHQRHPLEKIYTYIYILISVYSSLDKAFLSFTMICANMEIQIGLVEINIEERFIPTKVKIKLMLSGVMVAQQS